MSKDPSHQYQKYLEEHPDILKFIEDNRYEDAPKPPSKWLARYVLNDALFDGIYAGELPEVTVKPGLKTKIGSAQMKAMFGDSPYKSRIVRQMDNLGYNQSQTELLSNLYNIWLQAQAPSSTSKDSLFNIVTGKGRAMYDPITNSMTSIHNYDDFISELAHAYQFKTKEGEKYKGTWYDKLPGDIKVNGKEGYERPSHYEYQAHTVLQPILESRIFKYEPGGRINYGSTLVQQNSMNQFTPQGPDFTGITTTKGRPYNPEYISYAYNKLKHLPKDEIAIALGTWIEESGGDPFAVSPDGKFQGINQWEANRYTINSKDLYKELDNQIAYYLKSVEDKKSWTHGGSGSGYGTLKTAYNLYKGSIPLRNNLESKFRAHSFGYTRPTGKKDSYNNRLKVVKQVYDRL